MSNGSHPSQEGMNFSESEVQAELRALARKFAQNELKPYIEEDERNETFRPELIRRIGELGLSAIIVPEEYEGAGLGYQEYCAALEELAAVSASYAISVSVSGLAQVILSKFGNDAQKKKFIPPLARGEHIGAFSLSEASSGSDAGSLRTTAKKVGNEYIVNGTKLWTTQGDSANTIILMARTGEPGPKGVSAFILEKGAKGFSLGKREKKMGLHISHTMELVLEDCRIPASNLLGREGDGFKVAMSALDGGRATIGAIACGVARGAIEVAVAHAKEREQFGQRLADFQGVSFMLADMATRLDASRLLVSRAAWMIDREIPLSVESSMAKLFATDSAMQITTDAVQVLGGSGYTQEFPVERYMREAKVLQIVEGTNQIQRMIIGRALAKEL